MDEGEEHLDLIIALIHKLGQLPEENEQLKLDVLTGSLNSSAQFDHEHWRMLFAKTKDGLDAWLTPSTACNRRKDKETGEERETMKIAFNIYSRDSNTEISISPDRIDTDTICDGLADQVPWQPRMYLLWAHHFGPAKVFSSYAEQPFEAAKKAPLPFPTRVKISHDGQHTTKYVNETPRTELNQIDIFNVFLYGDRDMSDAELEVASARLQRARELPEKPGLHIMRAVLQFKLIECEIGIPILTCPEYREWERKVKNADSLANHHTEHEQLLQSTNERMDALLERLERVV
ncbi:Nn.00g030850.m01.CDS01 [Neocucurbitaria sp. VM-36]